MCICGSINKNLTFEKSWICPTCKILIQDRDIHAATNIKKFALHSQNLVGQVLPEFKPAEKSWFQTSSMKQEISFEKK
jgi:transposase